MMRLLPSLAAALLVVAGCPEASTTGGAPDVGAPTDVDSELDGATHTDVVPDVAPDIGPPGPPLYRAGDGVMTTGDGHVLLLRGMNFSGQSKGAPDHLFEFDGGDLDMLLAHGVNSVRALTFWNAVQPDAPGVTDEAYGAAYAGDVKRMTDAGLYVVLDMHQDVWGEPFAVHGAPGWACPDETKVGYEPQSPWWSNYATEQVMGCFDNFWSSPSLRTSFAQAWQTVASAVCHDPKVVGFDIMNEPFPGSALADPDFDNEVLRPFYEEIATAIESVCPGRLYFFEHSAGAVLGFAKSMDIPQGWRDRVVIASHFYPRELHESDGTGYDGDIVKLEEDLLDDYGHHLDAGVPVWIGEFGGLAQHASFGVYMEDIHTLFNKHLISSALWDYYSGEGGFGFLDSAGEVKEAFQGPYSVPVPTLMPARPTRSVADWSAASMELDVTCVAGRGFEVHFPAATCSCVATPAGAVEAFVPARGAVRAACLTEDAVTLSCSCPP